MSTVYHTPISTGAPANAATFNTVSGALDAAIGAVVADAAAVESRLGSAASVSGTIGVSVDSDGTLNTNAVDAPAVLASSVVSWAKLRLGANIDNEQLISWAYSDEFRFSGTPTYDSSATDTIASCAIVWPDGSTGTFTATVIDTVWQEPTTYTLSHALSSKTVTVSGLVRNSAGQITTNYSYSVS